MNYNDEMKVRRERFWSILKNKHDVSVPYHIRNIFYYESLDTPWVLDEINKDQGNEDRDEIRFPFEVIEKEITEGPYDQINADKPLAKRYGPTFSGDPKGFRFSPEDREVIKRILLAVKEKQNVKNYWNKDYKPTARLLGIRFDEAEEQESLRQKLRYYRNFPAQLAIDPEALELEVQIADGDCFGWVTCPECDRKLKLKKEVSTSGISTYWTVSSFVKHLKRHLTKPEFVHQELPRKRTTLQQLLSGVSKRRRLLDGDEDCEYDSSWDGGVVNPREYEFYAPDESSDSIYWGARRADQDQEQYN